MLFLFNDILLLGLVACALPLRSVSAADKSGHLEINFDDSAGFIDEDGSLIRNPPNTAGNGMRLSWEEVSLQDSLTVEIVIFKAKTSEEQAFHLSCDITALSVSEEGFTAKYNFFWQGQVDQVKPVVEHPEIASLVCSQDGQVKYDSSTLIPKPA